MAAEDGLKAQKLLAQGSALGNVGKNKVALKGQKLSISKLLPFQGDFVVSILKPRALPWAKSFCPFRAYGMWLMTHPLAFLFSFFFSLHAARYAERGGDGRQDADGYLNHHFPGFFFHHLFL